MQDNENNFNGFEHLGLNLRPFKRGVEGGNEDNSPRYQTTESWQPADSFTVGAYGETAAEPSAVGTYGETAAEPSAVGTYGETAAEPSAVGTYDETAAEPSAVGTYDETAAEPSAVGTYGETAAEPSVAGAYGETTAEPSVAGTYGETTAEPSVAGAYGETAAEHGEMPEAGNEAEEEPFFTAEEDGDESHKTIGEIKRSRQRRRRIVTERERIRRQKRARAIRTCVMAVLGGGVAVAALLTYFLLIVDNIEFYGVSRYTLEELLESSGLRTGRHIWLQNTAEAEDRLEQNVYVANAVITRVYPDKLVVNITEREEAAVLVGVNVHAVIDNKGYVLYIGARNSYDGLIQISGMGSSGYHVGQRLGEESDFNPRTLVQLMAAVYESGMEKEITYIDMGNPLSINMETLSGVKIHLGQPDDAEQKLNTFKVILPTLKAKGLAAEGTIDLSARGEGVYSPPRTPEPVIAPTPTPQTTGEGTQSVGGEGESTGQTQNPAATPSPLEPQRTPSPTDAFSG